MKQPLITSREKKYTPLAVGLLLTIVLCASLAFMHVRDHARLESLESEVSSLKVANFKEKAVGPGRPDLPFEQCKADPEDPDGQETAIAGISSIGRKLLAVARGVFMADNYGFAGRDAAAGPALCLEGRKARAIIGWIQNDSPNACFNLVYQWTANPAAAVAGSRWVGQVTGMPNSDTLLWLWRDAERANAQATFASGAPLTVEVHVTVAPTRNFAHSHFTIAARFN